MFCEIIKQIICIITPYLKFSFLLNAIQISYVYYIMIQLECIYNNSLKDKNL